MTGKVSDSFVPPPWPQATPQQKGRDTEKRELRKMGARPHPGSGSGRIRHDGSTDEEVIEIKEANRSFTVNRAYIEALYNVAIRQGKDPLLRLVFPGFVIDMNIRRTAP